MIVLERSKMAKRKKLEKLGCNPNVLKLLRVSNTEEITSDSLLSTATDIIKSIEKRLDSILRK